MKAQWQQEKETLGAVGKIKQEIDAARVEAEQAQRTGIWDAPPRSPTGGSRSSSSRCVRRSASSPAPTAARSS
jgi:hypothetical protein